MIHRPVLVDEGAVDHGVDQFAVHADGFSELRGYLYGRNHRP